MLLFPYVTLPDSQAFRRGKAPLRWSQPSTTPLSPPSRGGWREWWGRTTLRMRRAIYLVGRWLRFVFSTSSHLISSHLISSHLISSYLICSLPKPILMRVLSVIFLSAQPLSLFLFYVLYFFVFTIILGLFSYDSDSRLLFSSRAHPSLSVS